MKKLNSTFLTKSFCARIFRESILLIDVLPSAYRNNGKRIIAVLFLFLVCTVFGESVIRAEARHLTVKHSHRIAVAARHHMRKVHDRKPHRYGRNYLSKNRAHSHTTEHTHVAHTGPTGKASIYSDKFNGRKTATGERFSQGSLTAASPVLPLGSKVKVTNKKTGKSVVVKVNDKQPAGKGRVLDLSKTAAHHIGVHDGVADVKTTVLKK